MQKAVIPSPLGDLVALANNQFLFSLGYADRQPTPSQPFLPGDNLILSQLRQELDEYFHHQRQVFSVPCLLHGTQFQKQVWRALLQISYGTTVSYLQLASVIQRPRAVRALANAVGSNKFGIIFPCHRIVHSSGNKVGYGGGAWRKLWLLAHERIRTPRSRKSAN